MRQIIPGFDPTAFPSGGTIKNPLPQNVQVNGSYGFWLWANESSVSIIVTVNADRYRVHPWEIAKIPFDDPTDAVTWSPEIMLTNANSAPISQCLIDAFTSDEIVTDAFPIPLVRTTNVGGVVNTALVSSLINDGNPSGIQIIETTPSGQSTSAFVLDNAGNLTLRTLSVNVWTVIMQLVAGTAVAAAAMTLNLVNGNMQANAINTTGTKNNGTGNYAFSSTGPISTDNKAFATDGSGNIVTVGNIVGAGGISATSLGLAGNTNFTRRGNFSGTGSGTVATGAGGTPTWIGITDNQSGSTATVGAVISGSNAVVTMGASHTWMGIAL